MIRVFFTVWSCFLFFSSTAQDTLYARKIVDTLTSKFFEGRGAVHSGEKKAATFIANEYSKYGLQPFNESYFQHFNYPINTIFGKLSIHLDDKQLVAGKDYIVGGSSSKIKGTFNLMWFNKDNLPKEKSLKKWIGENYFKDKFIVLDNKGIEKGNEIFNALRLNLVHAAGVIFLEDKLTKGLSLKAERYAILKIMRTSIKKRTKKITLEINQQLLENYESQNVIGYLEGTTEPDSFIVISAHYDHLGRMGNEVYFPGANDNASGVAMLLNLLDYYSHKKELKKSIVFIAFGAEESGIIGSKYFVDHPTIDLNKIKFEINVDLLGTGSEGVMVVNGAIHSKELEMLKTINSENDYVKTIKKRGKAANSDHYWFTEKGVPAFFIYTLGGIKAYHDVDDVSKTLPLTEFEDCFRLIRDFINQL